MPNLITGDVTGLRGVDLGVRDVAAQARFYTDIWRLSVAAERGGSVYLRGSGAYCHILALHPRNEPALLSSLRCNDDHPNIAFHPGESSTLHHIAFEMDGIDSVMRGAGRMRDAGRPIEWGPGRHGPGNNVFAYFIGPDEFVIEYTAEVEKLGQNHRVREPENWVYPPGHSDQWGATLPPSARMKAAQEKIRFAGGLFHP